MMVHKIGMADTQLALRRCFKLAVDQHHLRGAEREAFINGLLLFQLDASPAQPGMARARLKAFRLLRAFVQPVAPCTSMLLVIVIHHALSCYGSIGPLNLRTGFAGFV